MGLILCKDLKKKIFINLTTQHVRYILHHTYELYFELFSCNLLQNTKLLLGGSRELETFVSKSNLQSSSMGEGSQ